MEYLTYFACRKSKMCQFIPPKPPRYGLPGEDAVYARFLVSVDQSGRCINSEAEQAAKSMVSPEVYEQYQKVAADVCAALIASGNCPAAVLGIEIE